MSKIRRIGAALGAAAVLAGGGGLAVATAPASAAPAQASVITWSKPKKIIPQPRTPHYPCGRIPARSPKPYPVAHMC